MPTNVLCLLRGPRSLPTSRRVRWLQESVAVASRSPSFLKRSLRSHILPTTTRYSRQQYRYSYSCRVRTLYVPPCAPVRMHEGGVFCPELCRSSKKRHHRCSHIYFTLRVYCSLLPGAGGASEGCCCCCLHIKSSFLPSFIISTPSVCPDSLS